MTGLKLLALAAVGATAIVRCVQALDAIRQLGAADWPDSSEVIVFGFLFWLAWREWSRVVRGEEKGTR